MRLYHGSTAPVERPDVAHSRSTLDFGPGFYLTSYPEQAERWALRKAALVDGDAVVSVYRLTESLRAFDVLRFPENDAAWVKFVCACRRGEAPAGGHDIIVGGVADDKVYEAVSMYARGLWDMAATLEALRFYERNDQFCFATQEAIDAALSFERSYGVTQ